MSAPRVIIGRRTEIRIADPIDVVGLRCPVCSARMDATSTRKYCRNACTQRAATLRRRGEALTGEWINPRLNAKARYSKHQPPGAYR